MQELAKGGSIIITASLASEAAYPELCAYSMSKFAVRALAVTAAQEYARDKIRVNAVSPGYVNTALLHAWDGHDPEERLKASPAGMLENLPHVDLVSLTLVSRKGSGANGGCKSVLVLS